jgi:hypothetical protein
MPVGVRFSAWASTAAKQQQQQQQLGSARLWTPRNATACAFIPSKINLLLKLLM